MLGLFRGARAWIDRHLTVTIGAAVTLFAGILRIVRLGSPRGLITLDEYYYPVNALGIYRHGVEMQLAQGAHLPASSCGAVALEPTYWVHPPVGKWLIGAGMKVFGCNAFGWRIAPALFGTACVLLSYLIGLRLWRSPWAAGTLALLVAVDGMQFVLSRIAMLDIFLSFFVLLAVWLWLEDRARTAADHRGVRWWLLGSGLASGFALATKWSAIPVLGVLAIGTFVIDRRRRGASAPRAALRSLGVYALVPLVFYVLAFVPWFLSDPSNRVIRQSCEGKAGISAWVCYQANAFTTHEHIDDLRFNADGSPMNGSLSRGISWVWMGRPTLHTFNRQQTGTTARDAVVESIPNPVTWLPGFILALPLCVLWAIKRRDRVAIILLVIFGALAVPWLLPTRWPLYMYYMTPAVPFLCAMVVHVLLRARGELGPRARALWPALCILPFAPLLYNWMTGGRPAIRFAIGLAAIAVITVGLWMLTATVSWRALSIAYVVFAVLMFAYFYPVLAYVRVSNTGPFGYLAHTWLTLDCDVHAGLRYACWR